MHVYNIMSEEGADETCDQTGHNSRQVSYSVDWNQAFL